MFDLVNKTKQSLLVRYDAWFVVFIAVLMALAAILTTAMLIWCINNGHGGFTGNFGQDTFFVNLECYW